MSDKKIQANLPPNHPLHQLDFHAKAATFIVYINGVANDNTVVSSGESFREFIYKDLASRMKKLSQLIAKSWLPEDSKITPNPKEIKEVFCNAHKSEEEMEKLKNFLIENEILSPGDKDLLEIVVDWSTFYGKVELNDLASKIVQVIPYPPKPSKENLSLKEIKAWVNNTNEKEIIPPSPYIPLTTTC
jgi:hypothetical protein